MSWWDNIAATADERRDTPARSVYEGRDLESAEEPGERWVRVAETSPLIGELRWVPGWERRAQGWVPLDELMRSDEKIGW